MIRMSHLYKTYLKTWPALKDINITVSDREFVFLTGPSGAGKSTFLKLIYGEERPTRGELYVFGKKVRRMSHRSRAQLRQKIGVVFQDFKLILTKTVYENMALAANVVGLTPSVAHGRILDILSTLHMGHKIKTPVYQLSGGEQQRAAIARALVTSPRIILADEPTGNLDPSLSSTIMDLLKQINASGTTVVMATHDYNLVDRYPFRRIELEEGRIRE